MSKPQISRDKIEALLKRKEVHDPLVLVGIRGWDAYVKGKGANQRNVFDDAFCLIGPHTFTTFNGNTDPSKVRKGHGTGSKRGMASLKTGLWRAHQLGLHKHKYLALVQTASKVTVVRDGNPPYEDFGWFGINIHHGSADNVHTSSEGCQTVRFDQWKAFIHLVQTEMHQAKLAVMPYLLVNAPELDQKAMEPPEQQLADNA